MKMKFGQKNQRHDVRGLTKELASIDEVNFFDKSSHKSFTFLKEKFELFDYVKIGHRNGDFVNCIIARIDNSFKDAPHLVILPTDEFIAATSRNVEPLITVLNCNNIQSISRNDEYELLLMIGQNHSILEQALKKMFDHEREGSGQI